MSCAFPKTSTIGWIADVQEHDARTKLEALVSEARKLKPGESIPITVSHTWARRAIVQLRTSGMKFVTRDGCTLLVRVS